MSIATITPAGDFDDDSNAAFAGLVEGLDAQFDAARRSRRPSRAALRRERFEVINLQLGFPRHRSREREV